MELIQMSEVASVRRDALPALTSLRFFAALAVVLYHFASTAKVNWPTPLANIVGNGSAGVPFFFILSGFVLAYNYVGRSEPNRTFWLNRFARIYPAYCLSLAVAFPAFLMSLSKLGDLGALPGHIATHLLLIQRWNENWMVGWNNPAWSLSCEALFYLLFPFALPLILRWNRAGLWAALTWLVGYAVLGEAVRFTGNAFLIAVLETPVRHVPLFIAGMILGREFLAGRRLPAPWFILGALTTLAIMGSYPQLDTPLLGGIACVSFAVVIFSAASLSGFGGRFLANATLVLLGEASYSLYILHEPIGGLLHLFAKRSGLDFAFTPVPLASAIFVIGVSVVAFKRIERPANRWIRSRFRSKPVGTFKG